MSKQSAEIVIVGGGVIGLAVARALALRGANDVLLIERHNLGKEASHAAAGILAPQAEADDEDDFFKLACSSRNLYPSFAASLLEETGIDVELDTNGTLYLGFNCQDEEEIQRRYEWQKHAGLAVEKLSPQEAILIEPCISGSVCAALRFPNDIQVENRRLLRALIDSCARFGVSILTDTTVLALSLASNRIQGLETSRGFIATRKVVVAGGAWTSQISGLPDIPIEPVRGQMLCRYSQPKIARHLIYSPRGYLVPRKDGRVLAGSTTESVGFDKSITSAGMDTISSNASEISPHISMLPIVDSWAGLRPRAPDNLPVLGPYGEIEGLVYATGHYRNGILLAPITGELIAELVLDKVMPPLLTTFTANRFRLVSVG